MNQPNSSTRRWIAWSRTIPDWENAFVTGNGRHGTMVTGGPGEQTIICVHEELFLRPWARNKVAVANIAHLLPEVRQRVAAGQAKEASGLACAEARRQLDAMGAKEIWGVIPHPAFDLKICCGEPGTPASFRRQLDLETGELLTHWDRGSTRIEQRVFSSRTHNANVVQLKAVGGGKLDVSLSLDETPGRSGLSHDLNLDTAFQQVRSHASPGWLFYQAQYGKDPGGYSGTARVTLRGGLSRCDGNRLHVQASDEILIVLRITPLNDGSEAQQAEARTQAQESLASLPDDYPSLLAPHAREHGAMFRRVTMDWGCAAQWASTPTEEMLASTHANGLNPLFLEQMHAMGRYLLISTCGRFPPPLQGIWGGGWKPEWAGGFVLDSNLNLAILGVSVGDLPECAESYFGYVERILPGWRLNAHHYLGCRGFLVSHYSDPENGRLHHFTPKHIWMYWPAGAAWNIQPFLHHAWITGDEGFLRERVLPLYRETAEFYEDYLELGSDGYYHVSPGISAENPPPGSPTLLARDCTMDIAAAREVFDVLVQIGRKLKLDDQEIAKWQSYHDQMLPYRINADGALAEFIPQELGDNYSHRHSSHLYPVFPGNEFLKPGTDPALINAAQVALDKRFAFDTTSAHGLVHVALMAVRLHDSAKVLTCLDRFARRKYVYTGLVTSHEPNHQIYNLDSVLSLQRLLMDMVVLSEPGRLELLPACPPSFPAGQLAGLRICGGHKLDITWNQGKLVSATLYPGSDDTLDITLGPTRRTVNLKSGIPYPLRGFL
jgi:hypothetical protein